MSNRFMIFGGHAADETETDVDEVHQEERSKPLIGHTVPLTD